MNWLANNWLVLSCVFILPLFFSYKCMKSGKWCTRLSLWSIFLSIVKATWIRCNSCYYTGVAHLNIMWSSWFTSSRIVLSFIPWQYITLLKHTCYVCLFLSFLSLKLDIKRLPTTKKWMIESDVSLVGSALDTIVSWLCWNYYAT